MADLTRPYVGQLCIEKCISKKSIKKLDLSKKENMQNENSTKKNRLLNIFDQISMNLMYIYFEQFLYPSTDKLDTL